MTFVAAFVVNPIAHRMAKTLWSLGHSECIRVMVVNPIAHRMAKTLWSFGHSECIRVNINSRQQQKLYNLELWVNLLSFMIYVPN